MKIAVVDDNADDRQFLADCIKKFAYRKKLALQLFTYNSGEDFLGKDSAAAFGIIFLDIYMGIKNGVETAKNLRDSGYKGVIIFCTTTADFALDGYTVNAYDYILKPYTYQTIDKMMISLTKALDEKEASIRIKSDGEWCKVLVYDIQYIENHGNYIYIHTAGSVSCTRMTLGEIEKTMEQYETFVRCDRGILVNLSNVHEIKDNIIITARGDRLPVSRRNSAMVNEKYANFIFKEIEREM